MYVSGIFNVKEWCGLETGVRSFNVISFESMGAFSYLHSIVTMALSCIVFQIKLDILDK